MKKTVILIVAALVAFVAPSVVSMNSEVSAQILKKQKAEIKEVTFKVHLHCAGCVKKVQENLSYEKGVKGLHVCMESQVIALKYDASKTDEETLKKAIIKLGVPVTGVSHEGHHHNHK